MLIKIHKSYRDVVAVCDKELLGKYFEEGKFQLDVKVSFFEGDEKNSEEMIEAMKNLIREDATFNIIGEKSVDCAIKSGIITESSVGKIQGIPFALVLL
ncbi:MAG: DUF424 family protein [Candidatus Pacearchaeota archaeon]|jgi:hypothetical protein